MLKQKLSFDFEIDPVENGVIVTWGLNGKSEKVGGSDDCEHHTNVCTNPVREEVMNKLIFAIDEFRKVLIPKLRE